MEQGGYLEDYNALLPLLTRKKTRFNIQTQKPQNTAQQINTLANGLKKDGNYQYAALFCLAHARAEEAKENPSLQANRLQDAGRLLMQHEIEQSPFYQYQWEEYVADSVQCYLTAAEIYIKNGQCITAARLCRELAVSLQILGKLSDAAQFFDKAAIFYRDDAPQTELICLEESFRCHVLTVDHDAAIIKIQSIVHKLVKGRPHFGPCAATFELQLSHAYIAMFLLHLAKV
eukprot:TRINITY_DN9707_c0_g1_i5.p1 TRINITY_DN9707_c0_g1~~TRINITY_DN9707_c0_g1_i5.p1  ORF type:complete len:231 (+),score=41.54 TRINITY_DN9707_c0_g1_i5:44-736(+)